MSVVDVKIDTASLRGLDKALRRLPKELQQRGYRSVLSTGARVFARHARKNAPEGKTGLLKKSIGIRTGPRRYTTKYAVIGPRKSVVGTHKGKVVRPYKYASLVEFGTVHSRAKPFMRPAMDSAGAEALEKMAKGLNRFMERAVAKIKSTGKI